MHVRILGAALLSAACATPEPAARRDLKPLVESGPPKPGPRFERTRVEAASLPLPGPYRLGERDVLSVIVAGHPEFSTPPPANEHAFGGTRVQADGKVHLPFVDPVPATGRTVLEIQKDVRERLRKFLEDPQVVVDVLRYESQRFYVLGEVNQPGVFPVDGKTTLLQALSQAGGLAKTADLGGAYVTRDGRPLPLSFVELIRGGNVARDISLRHGDLVFVPSLENRRIFVLGEVKRPGRFPMDRHGMTLADAIAEAGGIDLQTADRSDVRIYRGSWKSPEVYAMSVRDFYRWGTDIRLRPWDRVVVAPRGLATWSRAMNLMLPFLQTTTNAAIAAAALSD